MPRAKAETGSSNVAVRRLLLKPGKTVEPEVHDRAPPVQLAEGEPVEDPTDQKNQDWFCSCENARNENCKRASKWTKLAEGRDAFSYWLASKHLGETTPQDYFPIYLLLKTKRHIARELLRDMIFNFHNEVHELALNPHRALKCACEHLDIPWNVKAFFRQEAASDEEAEEGAQDGGDKDDPMEGDFKDVLGDRETEDQQIINHLIDVMCALMQYTFEYFSPISAPILLELLNSIYIDLLKVNGLSQNQYFFCFSRHWLVHTYLEKFPMYRNHIFFLHEMPAPTSWIDTGEASVTEVVRTNDLRSIEVRLQESKKPKKPVSAAAAVAAMEVDDDVIEMKPEVDVKPPVPAAPDNQESSSDDESNGVANNGNGNNNNNAPVAGPSRPTTSRRAVQKTAQELKAEAKARNADALQMWKFSYLKELLEESPFEPQGLAKKEEETEEEEEECQCGKADCKQCAQGGCICGGNRCYVLCRCYTKFIYGDLLAKNAPHLYLPAHQDQALLEEEVAERNRRRAALEAELTEVKRERQREAKAAAEARRREDEAIITAANEERQRQVEEMEENNNLEAARLAGLGGTGGGRSRGKKGGKRGRKGKRGRR